ncbi:3-ketoacyl-CoA thiolase, mitochondrial-like isoform X1 [Liolophura sinensis]|uniref:3-ketoacyl-CoA thiolase, mitochondrial-like isoform X1 n=1 Tax=Liolophura sinensis TaxID=3198878 RepID=UPI0031580E30
MSLSRGIYIVAAKRTAFGTFGGKLKNSSATDLGEIAAKGALKAGNINPELIDAVFVGTVAQTSGDAAYISRHIGLRAGVSQSTPCLTLNRLCGSGFQAVVSGAQDIELRQSEVVLCGGAENMSQAPYTVRNVRFGTALGVDLKLEDTLWATLTDAHIKTPMGVTAENLAEKYKLSRQTCDEFALRSQSQWHKANEAGVFKAEIEPVTVKGKKGKEEFATDEHPRMTTLEKISSLPPVFKKDGVVNAGNASGICDGAGVVILASEEAVQKHSLIPLARLIGYGISGCDPSIMGIGPVPASKKAFDATGLKLDAMDLIEVNEAFAPQTLAVMQEMGLDPEKTNVNGGAIALGHPVGASGARITAHLTHELRRRGLKYGLGSACIGGGQGITVILESCK